MVRFLVIVMVLALFIAALWFQSIAVSLSKSVRLRWCEREEGVRWVSCQSRKAPRAVILRAFQGPLIIMAFALSPPHRIDSSPSLVLTHLRPSISSFSFWKDLAISSVSPCTQARLCELRERLGYKYEAERCRCKCLWLLLRGSLSPSLEHRRLDNHFAPRLGTYNSAAASCIHKLDPTALSSPHHDQQLPYHSPASHLTPTLATFHQPQCPPHPEPRPSTSTHPPSLNSPPSSNPPPPHPSPSS